MRIEHMPDAVRGQAQLYYRLPMQPGAQPPRRVQAVQQSSISPEGTMKVGTAPPDDSITLDLSAEGREAARKAIEAEEGEHLADAEVQEGQGDSEEAVRAAGDERPAPAPDRREIDDLLQRDHAARAREQAMRAAAGSLPLGAPNYAYKVGPDGRLYVVDSSVNFDLSDVPGDPEATLRKAEQIRKVALAAAESSGQDRAAAAMAAAMAARARHALRAQEARGKR